MTNATYSQTRNAKFIVVTYPYNIVYEGFYSVMVKYIWGVPAKTHITNFYVTVVDPCIN